MTEQHGALRLVANMAIVGNRYDRRNVGDQAGIRAGGYVAPVSIDPYGAKPLYAQLAAILRGRIGSGELEPLARLPSESTLVQEHGVSRDTVRRAIRLLREEGLVFTLGQRGTYVGPKPGHAE